MIVQAGCFGEHAFSTLEAMGSRAHDDRYVQVVLKPGMQIDSSLGMRRCNGPTLPSPGTATAFLFVRVTDMTRILITRFTQEISVFNPVLTCYEDFEVRRGADIIETVSQCGNRDCWCAAGF